MAQMAARGRRRYELRVEIRGAAASKSELRGVQLLSNEVPSLASAHSEVARRRPLAVRAALRTLPDRACRSSPSVRRSSSRPYRCVQTRRPRRAVLRNRPEVHADEVQAHTEEYDRIREVR